MKESARILAQAIQNGDAIYVPQKEIGRLQDLLSKHQLLLQKGRTPSPTNPVSDRTFNILSDDALVNFASDPSGNWKESVAEITLPDGAAEMLRGTHLSRASTAKPQQTTEQSAEDIIQKKAATARPLDALVRIPTQALRIYKLTTAA